MKVLLRGSCCLLALLLASSAGWAGIIYHSLSVALTISLGSLPIWSPPKFVG
jgi:hypothetical protein